MGIVLETHHERWHINHCRLPGADYNNPGTSTIKRYLKNERGQNDESKVVLNVNFSDFVQDDLTSYTIPNIVCTIIWSSYGSNIWTASPSNISAKIITYDSLLSEYNNVYTHSQITNSIRIVSELKEVMFGSGLPVANTLNHYYLYFTPTQKQTYTIKLDTDKTCNSAIFSDLSIDPSDMNKFYLFPYDKPIFSPECKVHDNTSEINCNFNNDVSDPDTLFLVRFALTTLDSCSIDISVENFLSLDAIDLPNNNDVSDKAKISVLQDTTWEKHLVRSIISISQVILKESATVSLLPNHGNLNLVQGELIKYSIDNDVCPGYSLSFDETSNTYSLVSPVGVSHNGVYVPTITMCEIYVVYLQFIEKHVNHHISSTSSILQRDVITVQMITTVSKPIVTLKNSVKPTVRKIGLITGSKNTYNIELKFDLELTAVPYYKMAHFNATLVFTMPNKAEFTTCFINDHEAFETAVNEDSLLQSSFRDITYQASPDFLDLTVNQLTVTCAGTHVEEKSKEDIIFVNLILGAIDEPVFETDFILPIFEETVDVYETFLSIISESGLTIDEREKILEMYKDAINKDNESGTVTEVYIKDWVTKTLEDMRVVDEITFSIDDDDIIREHVEDTLEDLRNEIISDMKHSDWVIETNVVAGGGEGSGATMPKRCRTSCGKGCLCGLGKTCVDNQDCMSAICHIPKSPASRVYFLNESKGTCVNKIPEDDNEKETDKDNSANTISHISIVTIVSMIILTFLY